MIAIAPLVEADLRAIHTRPEQAVERAGEAAAMLADGPAWTVRDGSGAIVACAGFRAIHPGHAIAWAEISPGRRADMGRLTRAVIAQLDAAPFARLTAMVRIGWPAAHRWAERLGFRCEGIHPGWGPGGEDYASYGRRRKEVIQ